MKEKTTKKIDDNFGLHLIDSQGNRIPLASLPVIIGRGEQNDVHLDDETVSFNHARIYYNELAEAVCIEDLGSLNGLLIENKPTRKNILQDGDQIRIGSISLTFRDTGYIPPSPL